MGKCSIVGLLLGFVSMDCPKCGRKWGVTNTATSGNESRDNILHHGRKLVGWYCGDFVVRIRKCVFCKHRQYTIEVIVDDLSKMFDIISVEGSKAYRRSRGDGN